MKAVLDNVLPAETLSGLDARFDHFGPGEDVSRIKDIRAMMKPLVNLALELTNGRGVKGAWFVRTQKQDPVTKPHFDRPGSAAVLHLSEITGGEFIFLDDEQVVEFKPNRLVVFTEEHEHQHRPPTSGDRRTLVMRFS